MNSYKIILAGIILLLATPGCKATTAWPFEQSQIKFSITLEQEVFCSYEDIRGSALITNEGLNAYLIYEKLVFFPIQVSLRPSAYFSIVKPSGESIEIIMWIDLGAAYESQFILFLPGAKMETGFDFGIIYPRGYNYFDEHGVYTAKALYENMYDIQKTIDGRRISSWVGELASNEVTFEIDPANCR